MATAGQPQRGRAAGERFRGRMVFVAPNSFVLRNWISSGLAGLCTSELALEPVFITPFSDTGFSSPSGDRSRNRLVPMAEDDPYGRPAGMSSLLFWIHYLRLRLFALELPLGSSQMMTLSTRRDAINRALSIVQRLLPRGSGRRSLVRRVVDALNPRHREVHRMLAAERPLCLVVGTPGFFYFDELALIEAHRLAIPTCCIMNSWDNMTSRGPMIRRPDLLMVWNEHMREQAGDIHRYPLERTVVVGSLQFSQYAEAVKEEESAALFGRLKLPYGAEYLLYLTGQHVPEYEAEDVAALLGMLKSTPYASLPLVVRTHPQANEAPFRAIGDPRLVLDSAPRFSASGQNGCSFGVSEMRSMAALLTHAKVVLSSWGTTALLEAAVFDRPIVQLRWMDAIPRVRADQAAQVHCFQRYLHLVPFDATGCRAFSESPADLGETIDSALSNDEQFRQKRALAVERLATPPLGAAPGRVIQALAEHLVSWSH